MADVNSVANAAVDMAIDDGVVLQGEELSKQLSKIRATATHLINDAYKVVNRQEALEQSRQRLLSVLLRNPDQNIIKFSIDKDNTEIQDRKRLMGQIMQLQNQILKLFGISLKFIFVYYDDQGSNIKIYEHTNTLGLLADTQTLFSAKTLKTDLASKSQYSDYDASDLNAVFREVKWRANYSKNLYKKSAFWIFWNPPRWEGKYFGNEGPLAEAYAYYFLNKINIFFHDIETDVGIFVNRAGSTDNKSGFLAGDLRVNNTEYAVKNKTGETMNISNILKYAQEMVRCVDESALLQYITQLKSDLKLNAASQSKTTLASALEKTGTDLAMKILGAFDGQFDTHLGVF